jgi:hypothetical protein
MSVFAVIVLFYLVLLLKWELVRRPMLYWVGILAIVATMFFGFFELGTSTVLRTLNMVFTLITTVVALGCAIGATYRGELPAAVLKNLGDAGKPQ